MQRFFSPSTGGFYTEQLHRPRFIEQAQTERERKAGKRPQLVPNPSTRIPADAVEVSDAEYARLFAEQAEGKAIAARGGKPVTVKVETDPAERIAQRRRERNQRLAASDWTQLQDAPLDPAVQAEWADYRQALRDMDPASGEFPLAPSLSTETP